MSILCKGEITVNKKGLITALLLFLAVAFFASFTIFKTYNEGCNCDKEKEEE